MDTATAYIHEIFSSIQGEGAYVGYRQIFLRLCECNLACHFCDTPESRERQEACQVEMTAGQRDFQSAPNPLSPDQVVEAVIRLAEQIPHHSLAVTGGEPLVQVEFLRKILPALQIHLPIFLETNGTLSSALDTLLGRVDFIAMDIKLPSATRGEDYFAAHREFLLAAKNSPATVFVKIIVTAAATEAELQQAFALVAEIAPNIEVILQPVTPTGGEEPVAPSPQQVLAWQALGLANLPRVRVIPQTHKMMGQI
jgi:organic radical activating enzyme